MHLANALGVAAVEHVGDQRLAKAHGSRGHVAHGGAGHIGDVLDLELREAVAAVAAALGVIRGGGARTSRSSMLGRGLVAKVAQHVFAQAAGSIAVALHLAEQAVAVLERPCALLVVERLIGSIAAVDQKATHAKIVAVPQQVAAGRVAIAAGSTRLLVVGLDALGHVVVDHVAHVGLVDAHTKGVGGNHHLDIVVDKGALALPAGVVAHAGMVAANANAAGAQCLGKLACQRIDRLAGRAIHDAALARMRDHVVTHPRGLGLVAHLLAAKVEVLAIEARHHRRGVLQAEHLLNIRAHALGRRSGKRRHDGALRQGIDELTNLQIGGAEILAPLAHAVGLVNGHERHANAAVRRGLPRKGQKTRLEQALGRHVHKLVAALARPLEHGVLLGRSKAGVEIAGSRTRREQRTGLVLHKRQQRTHHKGDAGQHERGHLVANGLAGARGHNAQRIATGKDRIDHAVLPRAKRGVAKIGAERVERHLLHAIGHGFLTSKSSAADYTPPRGQQHTAAAQTSRLRTPPTAKECPQVPAEKERPQVPARQRRCFGADSESPPERARCLETRRH